MRSSLRSRRGIVDGSQEAVIIGATRGTRIEVEDVLIRGTPARASDLKAGYGVDVEDDAVLVANRVWLEDNESSLQVTSLPVPMAVEPSLARAE